MKTKIQFVCSYFSQERGKNWKKTFLQSMVGSHIYSLIDHDKYEFIMHHENWHGQLKFCDSNDFNIVILTGLQKDFDRMRQLSYFFRKKGALVIGGGNICTMFPDFSINYFDVVFSGGIECISQFIVDFENNCIKTIYYSPQNKISNYSVDFSGALYSGIHSKVHFIETSRGCNFKCDFCVIPAEGAVHSAYRIENIVKSIDSAIENSYFFSIKRLFPTIFFIDNNLSNNISHLMEICSYLKEQKKIKAWGAMVTQNILQNHDLIRTMAESKCRVLFTGIESLDLEFINKHNKKQNIQGSHNLLNDVHFAQSCGIVIYYPYMFDPRISSIEDIKRQIDMLLSYNSLSFPLFFTTVSPFVGTKLFWESLKKRELLPNLRLRDLDGQCLCFKSSLDENEKYGKFFYQLYSNRKSPINYLLFLIKLFRNLLNIGLSDPLQVLVHFMGSINHFITINIQLGRSKRNYIGGIDILDPQYKEYPKDITDNDFEKYFTPITITDKHGEPSSWLAPYLPFNIEKIEE